MAQQDSDNSQDELDAAMELDVDVEVDVDVDLATDDDAELPVVALEESAAEQPAPQLQAPAFSGASDWSGTATDNTTVAAQEIALPAAMEVDVDAEMDVDVDADIAVETAELPLAELDTAPDEAVTLDAAPADAMIPEAVPDATVSPQTPAGDVAEPDATPASAGVPAHLDLPSFPEFDMSFDPDLEPEPEPEPEQPAVVATTPAAPPPAAPPPVRRAVAKPAPAPQAAAQKPLPQAPMTGLPTLPNFGALPNLGDAGPSRNLTLIAGSEADLLAKKLGHKSKAGVIVTLLLVALGALGGAAYWKKELVMAELKALVNGEVKKVEQTPAEKAKVAFAEGVAALKKDDKAAAIASFEKAIAHDSRLAEAYFRLAVVHASDKAPESKEKAVKYYRSFLSLAPNAPQAAEVKKVIDDWDKAQAKKEAEAKTNAAAQDNDSDSDKNKKKRRRKRNP